MAPRHVEAEPFSSHQAVFVEVFTLSNIRRRLWGVVCTLAVTGAGGPVQQKSSNIIERDDVAINHAPLRNISITDNFNTLSIKNFTQAVGI